MSTASGGTKVRVYFVRICLNGSIGENHRVSNHYSNASVIELIFVPPEAEDITGTKQSFAPARSTSRQHVPCVPSGSGAACSMGRGHSSFFTFSEFYFLRGFSQTAFNGTPVWRTRFRYLHRLSPARVKRQCRYRNFFWLPILHFVRWSKSNTALPIRGEILSYTSHH
jgi:hypothetical protein